MDRGHPLVRWFFGSFHYRNLNSTNIDVIQTAATRQAVDRRNTPNFFRIETWGSLCSWPDIPVITGLLDIAVIMPCLSPLPTSHEFRGYAAIAPAMVESDDIPQNMSPLGSSPPGIFILMIAITGIIPTMTKFIETVSAKNVFLIAVK